MDYRNMNEDSLQQGVTEVANRIFREGLERGRVQGRVAMARELLAALELAYDTADVFYRLPAIERVMEDYRARFPVTEPDKDEGEDGDNGGR